MSEGIILAGNRYACRAPVLTWEEHGMEFVVGRGARRRVQDIDLFVVHWTGSENPPTTMFRTLEKRELGIEFAIGREETAPGYATIWQFADPIMTDTFDAGYVNKRSMGVEIVNYGFRRWKNLGLIPKKGKDRDRYKTEWNGRRPTYARFYPHQLHSLLALIEAVIDSGLTKIERRVPRSIEPVFDRWGGASKMLRRPMTKDEMADFAGIVGHNHVTKKKADPGTDALEFLIANGC
jgi:hypothetical protein